MKVCEVSPPAEINEIARKLCDEYDIVVHPGESGIGAEVYVRGLANLGCVLNAFQHQRGVPEDMRHTRIFRIHVVSQIEEVSALLSEIETN